jgi:hypothetical protein
VDLVGQGGFYFADFMGDHAVGYGDPDGERLNPDQIAYWTNCIPEPPRG